MKDGNRQPATGNRGSVSGGCGGIASGTRLPHRQPGVRSFILHPSSFIVLLALWAAPVLSAEPPVMTMEEAVAVALQENPELIAARHRINAARARIPQAGSLPDPMLEVEFGDITRPHRSAAVTVTQGVPFPGKLSLRKESARQGAQATAFDYKDRVYDVISRVKKAYLDLYLVNRSTQITLANQDLLRDFVKIAEAKYSVGQGLQQDVLRAQLELSRITDELIRLRQQRESSQAVLNTLLSRPPQTPLGTPASIERHRLGYTLEQLQQIAAGNRAALLASERQIAQGKAELALARKDLRPDFEFGLAFNGITSSQVMSPIGPDVMGMVAINLPIYARTKQRERIRETSEELRARQADYLSSRNGVMSDLRDLMSQAERGRRQAALLETGIIPQAEASLESARAGYQVNKVDFLTLLDSQIALFNFQLEYYRTVAEYEKALADLEMAVSKALF